MSVSTPPSPLPGPPAKTHSRTGWWVVILLVILIVIGAVFFLRHRAQSSSAGPAGGGGGRGAGMGPTMVSTVTARDGDIDVYVNALGVVTPLSAVSVNSRVAGQIMKLYYQEGQMVKAGDPLIDIDPGPAKAAVTQAQGQFDRDNAQLADAKLDLERYQEAFASNAIPKQQLDTQVAVVKQDQGTVEVDQGVLDNAKVQLAYCHICAPISGRIGLRLLDAGNIVQAGSTNLVVITQLKPISVIFNVAEDDLPQIQEQLRQGEELAVDAFDRSQQKKLASGTLETLDNEIDPTTGTVRFRATFSNDDESLFPNQFVNARLLVTTLEDVTLLPNTAIQRNADTAFVYVIKPDSGGTNEAAAAPAVTAAPATPGQTGTNQPVKLQTISLQTITTGTTDGNVTEVEGIDPGTVVVADNFNKLSDGAKVIVRPPGGRGKGGQHAKKPDTGNPQ